jgi:hypothetical protein
MSDESPEITLDDLMSGIVVSPEMVQDLRVVAQLDGAAVARITGGLSQLQGFQTQDTVRQALQTCLAQPNPDVAKSILRTLLNLKQNELDRTLSNLDRWRQKTPDRQSDFTDDMFQSLRRNLESLVGSYAGIDLLRKANRLLREVGNEFKDIAFFCDMRPVFDRSRTNVEGFVTLANMRLVYLSQDGSRHACELALTEEELRRMISEGNKALGKLDVLKATIERVAGQVRGND